MKSTGIFEAALLPDSQKEALCRSLLDEFGATVSRTYDEELIHGCLLPWASHKDQKANPSASLNWSKLTYKCLGCGGGGGLLWFIAACRGVDSDDARKWLEKSQGLGNEVMGLADLLAYFDALAASGKRVKAEITTYDERLLAPWDLRHPYMFDPPEEGGRGIPMETLDRFRVGYAENYRVRQGEDGQGNPKFIESERIVIPHFWEGRLVGWQSRKLADDGTPKYVSSPDFPKDQTLYNYDRTKRMAVVVESPASVLRHAHHMHVEATFGANVTDSQIRLLQRHSTVVLWMDNDTAGWECIEGVRDAKGRVLRAGLAEALAPFVNLLIVDSPWADDPADLPDSEVQRLVEQAVPYGIWERPKEVTTWDSRSSGLATA